MRVLLAALALLAAAALPAYGPAKPSDIPTDYQQRGVAVTLVDLIDRPSAFVELAIYVGLGLVWILPLRPIFLGIAQPDPEKEKTDGRGPSA